MKLSDVKVGMRVGVLDDEGDICEFANVMQLHSNGEVLVSTRLAPLFPVYLRKVKPKKSVSFEGRVSEWMQNDSTLLNRLADALHPFIGKCVRISIKEIK